jgi:hypothetical protein
MANLQAAPGAALGIHSVVAPVLSSLVMAQLAFALQSWKEVRSQGSPLLLVKTSEKVLQEPALLVAGSSPTHNVPAAHPGPLLVHAPPAATGLPHLLVSPAGSQVKPFWQ